MIINGNIDKVKTYDNLINEIGKINPKSMI